MGDLSFFLTDDGGGLHPGGGVDGDAQDRDRALVGGSGGGQSQGDNESIRQVLSFGLFG